MSTTFEFEYDPQLDKPDAVMWQVSVLRTNAGDCEVTGVVDSLGREVSDAEWSQHGELLLQAREGAGDGMCDDDADFDD